MQRFTACDSHAALTYIRGNVLQIVLLALAQLQGVDTCGACALQLYELLLHHYKSG